MQVKSRKIELLLLECAAAELLITGHTGLKLLIQLFDGSVFARALSFQLRRVGNVEPNTRQANDKKSQSNRTLVRG